MSLAPLRYQPARANRMRASYGYAPQYHHQGWQYASNGTPYYCPSPYPDQQCYESQQPQPRNYYWDEEQPQQSSSYSSSAWGTAPASTSSSNGSSSSQYTGRSYDQACTGGRSYQQACGASASVPTPPATVPTIESNKNNNSHLLPAFFPSTMVPPPPPDSSIKATAQEFVPNKMTTLEVKNLPLQAKEADLKRLFAPFAAQTQSQLVAITHIAHRRLAYIDYDSTEAVKQALQQEFTLLGKSLSLKSKSSTHKRQLKLKNARHQQERQNVQQQLAQRRLDQEKSLTLQNVPAQENNQAALQSLLSPFGSIVGSIQCIPKSGLAIVHFSSPKAVQAVRDHPLPLTLSGQVLEIHQRSKGPQPPKQSRPEEEPVPPVLHSGAA